MACLPHHSAPWAPGAGCLEDLCVRIAELDGNVALQLVLEPHRLHPRDGLHHCGLAMRHMANCACMRSNDTVDPRAQSYHSRQLQQPQHCYALLACCRPRGRPFVAAALTNVDGRLARDDFWCEWRQLSDIEICQVLRRTVNRRLQDFKSVRCSLQSDKQCTVRACPLQTCSLSFLDIAARPAPWRRFYECAGPVAACFAGPGQQANHCRSFCRARWQLLAAAATAAEAIQAIARLFNALQDGI